MHSVRKARDTLRQVGTVLIVIGLLDIGLMIHVVSSGRGYSSSLNIFAVTAGVFLTTGNLRAARLVTWFAAFLMTGLIGAVILLFPLLQPLDLLLTEWRLKPIESSALWGISALFLTVVVWVYYRLRSRKVLAARAEAGVKNTNIANCFASGVRTLVFLKPPVYPGEKGYPILFEMSIKP